MRLPDRQTLLPFLRWLPGISRKTLGNDLLVGLTGAILALPQSLAYALIAGLPAEYGLYAAIVPVIIACLWGSSWHLICGPTAAISIVLFTSVSPMARIGSDEFIALILLLTFLAGLFQWLLGMLRFGALVNFVSQSVVLGFTLGAALVIAIGQMPNLLGVEVASQPTALTSLLQIGQHLPEAHWPSLALAAFTLLLSVAVRKLWPKAPALLIGLVYGSLLAWWLPARFTADIALVAPFAGGLPPLTALSFDLYDVLRLLPAAVACGMLGLVTSLSIARALLKDPPILILDEATSALDAVTEAKLNAALDEVMKGRTTFVIAHRLSTIRNATRILVFENGRVIESGTFDELVAKGGHFAELARAQFMVQENARASVTAAETAATAAKSP